MWLESNHVLWCGPTVHGLSSRLSTPGDADCHSRHVQVEGADTAADITRSNELPWHRSISQPDVCDETVGGVKSALGMLSTHGFQQGLRNVHEHNVVLERKLDVLENRLTSLQTKYSDLKKEVNMPGGLRDQVIELRQKLGCAAFAFGSHVCGACCAGKVANQTGPERDGAGAS
jgi:hypothetical protein